MGEVGAVGVGVSVDEDDVDFFGGVPVGQGGVGDPVGAGYLFRVEGNFLVESSTEGVQHATFQSSPEAFGVDDEAAIVGADEAFHPDVAGHSVDLYFGDFGYYGLAADPVGDASSRQDVAFGRLGIAGGASLPGVGFRRRFDAGHGANPLETGVVVLCGFEEAEAEFDGVGFGGEGEFVNEGLAGESDLGAIGVAKVAGPEGRFPDEGHADYVGGHAAVGDCVAERHHLPGWGRGGYP